MWGCVCEVGSGGGCGGGVCEVGSVGGCVELEVGQVCEVGGGAGVWGWRWGGCVGLGVWGWVCEGVGVWGWRWGWVCEVEGIANLWSVKDVLNGEHGHYSKDLLAAAKVHRLYQHLTQRRFQREFCHL